MINILPLSPSNFFTFEQCPFKFWCSKDKSIVPLPYKVNIYAEFGNNLHKIIAKYYSNVKKTKEFAFSDVHSTLSNVVTEQIPKLGIEDINRGYSLHLRNFEEFDSNRIKRNWKVIDVEKKLVTPKLKGFVDVLFDDEVGNVIVVDWKTGKWKKDFLIQGYIYKLLSKGDSVIFYQTMNGIEHVLKEQDLNIGKSMATNIIKDIQKGINDRKVNPYCNECEYNLYCKLNSLGYNLEDV